MTTLRRGSTGPEVRRLQERLNFHGAKLSVDGGFGPITEAAVVAFQAGNRLATDGIVGPRTWAALGKEPEASTVEYPSGLVLPVVAVAPAGYEMPHPAVAGPLVQLTSALRQEQVSDHFRLGEFACHDSRYDYIRLAPELVVLAEELRAECGGEPVLVTSGYRPTAYNRDIGGANKSYHIDGAAADIRIAGETVETAHIIAGAVVGSRGGLGKYPRASGRWWIHVDIRGHRQRWTR